MSSILCRACLIAAICCLALHSGKETARAQTFVDSVQPLIESTCISCHDADTETGLNFETLSRDLSDPDAFRMWEHVFDRTESGEMPPDSEDRPDPEVLKPALQALRSRLKKVSVDRQKRVGRVPARRLTKLEYKYTLRDLLRIPADVTAGIPNEVDAGTFDTVGENQRISAVHMASYLNAADQALNAAIQLGRKQYGVRRVNYNSPFLLSFHHKPLNQGGSVSRQIDGGVALFRDADYLLKSDNNGFVIPHEGLYRITSKVEAYQTKKTLTYKLILKEQNGSTTLIKSVDLEPGGPRTVEATVYLKPGDSFYNTFVDDGPAIFAALAAAGSSKKYKGRGLALYEQKVAGPITDSWPPSSTKQLLGDVKFKRSMMGFGGYSPKLEIAPEEQLAKSLDPLVKRAFRRPLRDGELEALLDLAQPAIEQKRSFVELIRLTMRSVLTSRQFLLFDEQPGALNDYALASRLSYFLWKSLPDDELLDLAKSGELSRPTVLDAQVDRMLADDKSRRFIDDFLGQWLLLHKINATSPDEKLYPEYDEVLGDALLNEPQLFFAELIEKNLSLTNFIDSDFTFVNRRLAEHYGIKGVKGLDFQRIELPEKSLRGGMLTQAAILKTTANGTVTSPVTRGNFVLTSILGTPPSPPPPSVGSIEPDTRGKTTIREILNAHRNIESCNKCHREIDPPGFALESFDPIGGHRTHYRANGKAEGFAAFFGGGRTYKQGPKVDPSGVTSDGDEFADIETFKRLLLEKKEIQIAKNFVSRLTVYATGAEIQFADREHIDAIIGQTQANDFRVRDIIHAVVRSRMFRNK